MIDEVVSKPVWLQVVKGVKDMKGKSVLFGVLLALSWGIAPSAFAQDHELEITLEVFDDIDDIRDLDAVLLSVEAADGARAEARLAGAGGRDEPDGRGE